MQNSEIRWVCLMARPKCIFDFSLFDSFCFFCFFFFKLASWSWHSDTLTLRCMFRLNFCTYIMNTYIDSKNNATASLITSIIISCQFSIDWNKHFSFLSNKWTQFTVMVASPVSFFRCCCLKVSTVHLICVQCSVLMDMCMCMILYFWWKFGGGASFSFVCLLKQFPV